MIKRCVYCNDVITRMEPYTDLLKDHSIGMLSTMLKSRSNRMVIHARCMLLFATDIDYAALMVREAHSRLESLQAQYSRELSDI